MGEFSVLEDQIRECYGRVVYTHKTHEKMADRCGLTLKRIKIVQIAFSALITSGATFVIFTDKTEIKVITAIVSLLNLIVSGYMKGFDPGGTAQKHKAAATSLWLVREDYLSLLTDLRMRRITSDKGAERRDVLQVKTASIYKGAPQTDAKAYSAARFALKENEEFTFSDTEIDCFVPSALRKVRS